MRDAPAQGWTEDLVARARSVTFKQQDEDDGVSYGPVFVTLDDGETYNYSNWYEYSTSWWGGQRFAAAWYSLRNARLIAEAFGLELEEC